MERKIRLKKNEDRRILNGHLWIFSNEISSIDGAPGAGEVIRVENAAGKFLGTAFYNPHSLIAARLISRGEEEVDFQFFKKRIEAALALRRRLYPRAETFRLVHGESDYLPGLIVDKYNDNCSIQSHSYAMDARQTLICDVLESLLHPRGIVERNEASVRSLEGLQARKGVVRGSVEPVIIAEHGLKYSVDLLEGQKTGFFLDQRENRKAIRRYAKGSRVLDCFCNEGGFSLNAAYGEATGVTGVDSSEVSTVRAAANAATNGLNAEFVTADAFDYLIDSAERKKRFDLVVLDPPSFAKSRKSIIKAKRGYRELNLLALRVLEAGGILATASCSHHLFEETFLEIINRCAVEAGRRISMLEWRGAAPDHPVLPGMPETKYLKMGIFQVE